MNRPKIKEYFGENATLQQVADTYNSQPELFNYAQALDRYIDELEESPVPDKVDERGWTALFTNEQNYLDFLKWQSQQSDAVEEVKQVADAIKSLIICNGNKKDDGDMVYLSQDDLTRVSMTIASCRPTTWKAQQSDAVEFGNWLNETNWAEKETWGKYDPPSMPTTQQLYEIFKKSKQ